MRLTGFELLTRAGFAARGVTYIIIGYLAVRSGRPEDGPGALGYLAHGNGRVLVGVMALGFASYALWRLADALLDTERHGTDKKGMGARLAAGASGLAYLTLAGLSAMLAMGQRSGSGGNGPEQGAAEALGLPGGPLIVAAGGACLFGVALWQGIKAWRASFRRHLEDRVSGRPWIIWLGRVGYGSRGLVFLGMAWLLTRAAISSDASQAGGVADVLAAEPGPLRYATAAGLMMFGLFSLVEARHRNIHTPNVG